MSIVEEFYGQKCLLSCVYGNLKVLGTFITEWDEGKATCSEMLATKESAQMYAERLAELATALGFDGWLVRFFWLDFLCCNHLKFLM